MTELAAAEPAAGMRFVTTDAQCANDEARIPAPSTASGTWSGSEVRRHAGADGRRGRLCRGIGGGHVDRGWAQTNPVVAEFQRRVDRVREEVLAQAFLDIGIDKKEARVLARIGLTILVGTQQIEEKVDRKRLDALLSEYQRWLEVRRLGEV